MKKKSYKRKKGPVQSKKISYDGINFASGLERYMYMALRKAKITALYEGQTFEEWGAANWGSTEADNPYEDVNPEESEAVQRAKKSASGARSVGGTDDEETNPWL